jgi:hypothetical protein
MNRLEQVRTGDAGTTPTSSFATPEKLYPLKKSNNKRDIFLISPSTVNKKPKVDGLGFKTVLYNTYGTSGRGLVGNDSCHTVIPMDYYVDHIVDAEFVRRVHAEVNGKLNRWRNGTIEIVEKIKELSLYDSESTD